MSLLYCTADRINAPSGGGLVTWHESQALAELGPCEVWGREQLGQQVPAFHNHPEPWLWDRMAYNRLTKWLIAGVENSTISDDLQVNVVGKRTTEDFRMAHFYAGTFSSTVNWLKKLVCKVTYTAAAHDVTLSRREHERLGVPYDYPHLTDPVQWKRYVQGYLDADVLICPSQHSASVMRGFGVKNRIEVIPHGCELPICRNCSGEGDRPIEIGPGKYLEDQTRDCEVCHGSGIAPPAPLPPQFRVGYLGSYGPDKGVVYLLQAWAKLNYSDAVLVLGGRDSNSPWVHALLQHTGARNVCLTGWVDDVSQFYSQISLYVQPSVTEGFGIEVLESAAHSRAVLCSTGAGAADVVPEWYRFPAADVDALASKIDQVKLRGSCPQTDPCYPHWQGIAADYTWDKIRQRYQNLWKELLA